MGSDWLHAPWPRPTRPLGAVQRQQTVENRRWEANRPLMAHAVDELPDRNDHAANARWVGGDPMR
eukprot:5723697-Lingulodinium_polyedra.AAC.1